MAGSAVAAAKQSLATGQGPAAEPRPADAPTSGALAASSLGTPWTELGLSSQPSARATPSMAYDPTDGYVIYFG
ncbi:MAG: hypothetical protein L3J91_05405, partial [Thermoplasmata archaeon]|nr:hypothetical protein [Thermoplasmata archaeon]